MITFITTILIPRSTNLLPYVLDRIYQRYSLADLNLVFDPDQIVTSEFDIFRWSFHLYCMTWARQVQPPVVRTSSLCSQN